ncbi:Site-specific DNA recombinase [Desulfocicer vacuolatum DSM 3385]|uniref:Site-specific DNA recombinase n=1 Tax=Desulfocicer vacuolatum DSM 3385 TaxID=1121400 RepID=A0A1W2A524_9BACT|nr:recombinase family protein [Desulfocicer vacuolatum]SMC55388.1 Site-specific DNA recombinase [Desulfocicer vacuolatum DSM 3385]
MKIYGYCRVSTLDQNPTMQQDGILNRYPDAKILTEKKSGTTTKGREKLDTILNIIDQGEKLVVWKLDRLARNMMDLLKIVELLKDRGASLEILDQAIDTSTASGTAFLQMLGVFAEFETNLRRERQMAGIQKAKAKGVYTGRKPSLTSDQCREILQKRNQGMNPTQLAREYAVSRATIYNVLKKEVTT